MEKNVKTLIEEGLKKSYAYTDYRAMVEQLVVENKSTGVEQTEALSNYSMLNDKRMKRLDKTIKLSDTALEKLKLFNKKVTWLVLTESWCGDAAQTLPVINTVAEASENITLKVILRDENQQLMDNFLTEGGRSIPKLIMVDDNTNEVIGDWGPRPSVATKMVKDYKEKHGKITEELKQDLQVWYNKDKGQSTVNDLLVNLLEINK